MSGVLAAALHRLLVLGFAATYHPSEERTAKRSYDRPDNVMSAAKRPCRTHIQFLAHLECSVNRSAYLDSVRTISKIRGAAAAPGLRRNQITRVSR
jgi:Na+/phosphate symporter